MSREMPSPFGHALAGATIGLLVPPSTLPSDARLNGRWTLPVASGLIAALPDADLFFHVHRTVTHSLTATVAVFILTMVVTGKVKGRMDWRLALVFSAAQGSHLLMDWLGADPFTPAGIELFWPFDRQFYISGLDWFPPTERRLMSPQAFSINLRAFVTELVVVGPMFATLWALTRRRRSRVRSSVPDSRPRPSA